MHLSLGSIGQSKDGSLTILAIDGLREYSYIINSGTLEGLVLQVSFNLNLN